MSPALDLMRRARATGMSVLLGCMIETSLGLTDGKAFGRTGGLAGPGRLFAGRE